MKNKCILPTNLKESLFNQIKNVSYHKYEWNRLFSFHIVMQLIQS